MTDTGFGFNGIGLEYKPVEGALLELLKFGGGLYDEIVGAGLYDTSTGAGLNETTTGFDKTAFARTGAGLLEASTVSSGAEPSIEAGTCLKFYRLRLSNWFKLRS